MKLITSRFYGGRKRRRRNIVFSKFSDKEVEETCQPGYWSWFSKETEPIGNIYVYEIYILFIHTHTHTHTHTYIYIERERERERERI